MLAALPDTRNRTASEIRSIFTRHGGNVAEQGSVGWLFKRQGVILADPAGKDPEELALDVIELGASDVQVSDGQLEGETEPEDFEKVKDGLEGLGARIVNAELTMSPSQTVPLSNDPDPSSLLPLMRALHDP